jgi:pyruvate-formate lyase
LIEAFFDLGGRQVQFNPMSRATLQDAQKNPKDYPDLMVKVSGYSFRFVDLSKALQDDIINRTEFSV